jgi:hypothetical protein
MKVLLRVLFVFFIMYSVNSFSQMGMGGMGGGMGNGMGGRGMNNLPQSPPPPAKKVDMIALTMDKLTKDLTLDTFQATVIKGYLEDAKKKEDLVFAEDIIDQAKMDKIKVLRDNFDKKLMGLLSKEQTEKFVKMKESYKKK